MKAAGAGACARWSRRAVRGVVLAILTLHPELQAGAWGADGAPYARCWSLGASVGRVEGLGDDLSQLAGPDDKAVTLEGGEQLYATPYLSEQLLLSLNLMHNFSVLQGAYGIRVSTVPFPRTFLRPWVAGHLTLNFLEDDRNLSDPDSGEDQYEGVGIGVAASAGVTIRLGRSLALEGAVKADQVFVLGRLENGDPFSDGFGLQGVYLRFVFLVDNR